MNHDNNDLRDAGVEVLNAQAASSIVIVCEHASAYIPKEFNALGVSRDARESHIAWDPGAMAVATHMARYLGTVLVASRVSRLVYDCNRPPEAPDAMPARSERTDVPGNVDLPTAQKAQRVARYYEPFRATLAEVIAQRAAPVLVTIHSFTPVFHGAPRDVEIGVLHDSDSRLADAMLRDTAHVPWTVRRNEPYGPKDGVTHTLKEHALEQGHLNVMLEVRNDLIADETAQADMARLMSDWVERAIAQVEAIREADRCKV
jgi:predicted N-formylglutamate amidohydrolase